MSSSSSTPTARFTRAARVTLVLVYVVILAGSIVRSTGAGMGCPDWPKCFGHYIPPTDISELQYEEGRSFKAGHFIIWENALWKAKHDLVATRTVDPDDWEKYTKHDYAVFNAAHTWTEYGNRLSGALLGLAALWMAIASLKLWRSDRTTVLASFAALVLIGFEAWLGALVVESKLAPVKITTHMVVAFIIVALVVWVVRRARGDDGYATPMISRGSVRLLVVCLLLTVAQTVMGTQVREEVDLVSDLMGEANRALWVERLGTAFELHRSFAWALIIANAALVLRLLKEGRRAPRLQRKAALLALLLLASIGTGVVLAWMAMPAPVQPTHLLLAALTFGVQISLLLDARRRLGLAAPASTPHPTSVTESV
jgi:heme a synthase